MKPFYVDIEDLTDEEVVEIYERAIANGADPFEDIASRGGYEHFGVGGGATIFYNCVSNYNTNNKLTLQQVRDQYPLPVDEEVLTPRDLACFQEVADAIGEEAAEIELGKVLACDNKSLVVKTDKPLLLAFNWGQTPQGGSYWSVIEDGVIPTSFCEPVSIESDATVLPEGENVPTAHTEALVNGYDMVKKPNHYQLFPEYGLEVKDINKRLLDNIEASDFDITLYEAGWFQQSMQYFLRCYAKNGVEDLEKGVQTMQFVIDSMKERLSNDK